MKKYVYIASVALATFATSCTADSGEIATTQSQKNNHLMMQKEGDSIGIDTGGQGGSTPIKP